MELSELKNRICDAFSGDDADLNKILQLAEEGRDAASRMD